MLSACALRAREYARLDAGGHAYLDFTGSALYPESLVARHHATLSTTVLGNPHAENPASRASTAVIDHARQRVLDHLDADGADYVVCFTANATGAMALVGSAFPFGVDTPFVLAADNHNSVNGIREYARRAGACVHYLHLDQELRLQDPSAMLDSVKGRGLLAFPAQSNFSGVKHPLSLVQAAQARGHRVLLDAAALLPMARLSLRDTPADFVAMSFYKMFGYPTGVGALVARRESLAMLRRPWFSGGTVEFVSVQHGLHSLRAHEQGFEDGTANFLDIAAVPAGLDYLQHAGLEDIESHAMSLALQLMDGLGRRTHSNGAPLAAIYGPTNARARGATVAFNVLDAHGAAIPFADVEERAREARVSVRGGCFCNPGASEAAFGFPADATARCLAEASVSGWNISRFARCLPGNAVGAIRASFGAPSNTSDLARLLAVVDSFA